MAILNRIRAALTPNLTIEDLEGEDVFTPLKDFGENIGARFGIESPRARRRREELQAERELELGVIDGKIAEELQGLQAMDPNNDEHAAVVSSMVDRAAIVSTMLDSPFEEMRDAGVAELSTLLEDIHSAGLNVEQQRVRDAELEAAGLTEEWAMMNTVADDLHRESTGFLEQRAAFGRILASASNPDAAGDLALIFNYMKLLDPGSTVREGEFATAQNAAGVEDRVRAFYNNIMTGERLLPETRTEFVNRSRTLYSDARASQVERNTRYLGRARSGGVRESLLADLALPIEVTEAEYMPAAVKRRQDSGEVESVSELPSGTERVDTGIVANTVSTIWNGAKAIAGDTARKIAGIELHRDPNGYLYEVESGGRAKRVGRDSRMIDPDTGEELELVDRGEGRYEWRRVGESGEPVTPRPQYRNMGNARPQRLPTN